MTQNDGETYKKYAATFVNDDKIESGGYEAVALEFLASKVRFSFKHCDRGRKYCITSFASDKKLLEKVYSRLGYFEDLDWQTARSLPRKNGISIEKKDTQNHKELSGEYSDFDTYGHMRVPAKNKSTFRIFGGLRDDLFYILRFDSDGSMNH